MKLGWGSHAVQEEGVSAVWNTDRADQSWKSIMCKSAAMASATNGM